MTVQQDNIKVSFTCQVKFSNDTDDEWCETTERSSGVMDTLLQELDIIQDGDRIIRFAPRNLITVKDLCLFTMCKWELRSKDRRVHSLCQTYFTN